MTTIHFTGHSIEITPALQSLIEKKFQRIERHFNHPITNVSIILSVQKLLHTAEVTLHVKLAEINAKATEGDMYKAIDLMLQKLDRQLIKHKQKMTDHQE
jgi:putative sigma-54 modulation protein